MLKKILLLGIASSCSNNFFKKKSDMTPSENHSNADSMLVEESNMGAETYTQKESLSTPKCSEKKICDDSSKKNKSCYNSEGKINTVSHVDIGKYVAHPWYEYCRYPNWFEPKDCTDVTAQYTIKDNGDLEVKNSCVKKNGKMKIAIGNARVVDKVTNSKLEVSFAKIFGKNFFYGDYWIIDLADDYSWAIVSDPQKEYLWILTKEKQISDELSEKLIKRVVELGFDQKKLIKTKHNTN